MVEKPYPQTAPVISDRSAVALPIKNLIGLLGGVAVGVWAYFGIVERINTLDALRYLNNIGCRLNIKAHVDSLLKNE